MDYFTSIITAFVAGGGGAALVVYLLKAWFEARLTASIQLENSRQLEKLKHEYGRSLEVFKEQIEAKQKIELVAEILSLWLAYPPGEPVSKEHRSTMNKLMFAATLWLPTPLVEELNKVLQHSSDAKSLFQVLLLARRELNSDTSLGEEFLGFMPYELEKSGYPESPDEDSSVAGNAT